MSSIGSTASVGPLRMVPPSLPRNSVQLGKPTGFVVHVAVDGAQDAVHTDDVESVVTVAQEAQVAARGRLVRRPGPAAALERAQTVASRRRPAEMKRRHWQQRLVGQ